MGFLHLSCSKNTEVLYADERPEMTLLFSENSFSFSSFGTKKVFLNRLSLSSRGLLSIRPSSSHPFSMWNFGHIFLSLVGSEVIYISQFKIFFIQCLA